MNLFEACNLQSLEQQLDKEKEKDTLSEKVDEIEQKMMEERESFGGKLIWEIFMWKIKVKIGMKQVQT